MDKDVRNAKIEKMLNDLVAFTTAPVDVVPLTEREQGLRDITMSRVRDQLTKFSRAEVGRATASQRILMHDSAVSRHRSTLLNSSLLSASRLLSIAFLPCKAGWPSPSRCWPRRTSSPPGSSCPRTATSFATRCGKSSAVRVALSGHDSQNVCIAVEQAKQKHTLLVDHKCRQTVVREIRRAGAATALPLRDSLPSRHPAVHAARARPAGPCACQGARVGRVARYAWLRRHLRSGERICLRTSD